MKRRCASLAILPLLVSACLATGSETGGNRFERQSALMDQRLEQEQAQYRERLEELSVPEQRDLSKRLQRQQMELRQLQEQQRRELLRRPTAPAPPPIREYRLEQQRQLYRFGLERQTWPFEEK